MPPSQWQNSPELLFFSVMVSAAQLGGIFDSLARTNGFRCLRRTMLSFAFGIFLLAAILSAGLYGVYVDQERHVLRCMALQHEQAADPDSLLSRDCRERLAFQTNLFTLSTVVACIVGGLGTATEWIRTWRSR